MRLNNTDESHNDEGVRQQIDQNAQSKRLQRSGKWEEYTGLGVNQRGHVPSNWEQTRKLELCVCKMNNLETDHSKKKLEHFVHLHNLSFVCSANGEVVSREH